MTDQTKREQLVSWLFFFGPKYSYEAIQDLIADNTRYQKALKSIADNTCCDKCQEAALVAKEALNNE